jgi:hypothetical protein
MTPNNRLEFDYPTIEAYKQFRIEAESKGFRHFLEIFDPNACGDKCPADLGRYVNDLIARTLAGVPSSGRPVFLKIAYHGPRAMEELVAYDPSLVAGILGGSSGTTHDAFKLLEDAKKYGARAALFGRKINNSEHALTFVQFLHQIANGRIGAAEAVKAYHGELEKLKIKPYRAIKDDLELTVTESSYAGGSGAAAAKAVGNNVAQAAKFRVTESMVSGGATKPAPQKPSTVEKTKVIANAMIAKPMAGIPTLANGSPDFKTMTAAQKVAYSRGRIQADLTRVNGDGR